MHTKKTRFLVFFFKKKRKKRVRKKINERSFELGNNRRSSRREHSARSHRASTVYYTRERRRRREWNDNGIGEGPSSSHESIFRATSCVRSHVARRRKVKSCSSNWRVKEGGEGEKRRKRKRKRKRERQKKKKSEMREWCNGRGVAFVSEPLLVNEVTRHVRR